MRPTIKTVLLTLARVSPVFQFMALALAILFLVLMAQGSRAAEYYYAPDAILTTNTVLSSSNVVAGSLTTNASISQFTSTPIRLGGRTFATFQVNMTTTNAGASNVVFYFKASLDGSNWTTTFPYSATVGTFANAGTVDNIFTISNICANAIQLGQVYNYQTGIVTFNRLKFLPVPYSAIPGKP